MECRKGCGACCIAPSILHPFYKMPEGKKAGERCVHLDHDGLCQLFNSELRPGFCEDFMAEESVCGTSFEEALSAITNLEFETKPE